MNMKTHRTSSLKSAALTIALFIMDNSSDGHLAAFIRCENVEKKGKID